MGLVVKLTSSLKLPSKAVRAGVCAEFANYVDDSGKSRLDRSNSYFLPVNRDVARARPPAGMSERTGQAPTRVIVPVNYSRGEICLEGFLARLSLERGLASRAPAATRERREWTEAIAEVWAERLHRDLSKEWLSRNRDSRIRVAIKFSLSPDPTDTRELLTRRKSMVELMRRTVADAWKEYEHIHGLPRGSIGFAWSVHLDQDHLHAHCFVFPHTEGGEDLRLSNRLRSRTHVPEQRRDYLTEFCGQVQRRYQTELARMMDPGPTPSLVEQLHRSLGCRVLVGAMRQLSPSKIKEDAIARSVERLVTEGPMRSLPGDRIAPYVRDWAKEGAQRQAERRGASEQSIEDGGAELELLWWRRLWLGLEFRRRRDLAREDAWSGVAEIAEAIGSGRLIGPKHEALPALLRRASSDLAPEISVRRRASEPVWCTLGRLRINQWLALGREVLLRGLVVDAISARAGNDAYLRSWFSADVLGLNSTPTVSVAYRQVAAPLDTPLAPAPAKDEIEGSDPALPFPR